LTRKLHRGAGHLEFDTPYSKAPTQAKRKLLNILIQETRSSVKKGEKEGEIVYKLREDGSVRKG